MKWFIAALISLPTFMVNAQSDRELGDQYFRNSDCSKALIHYARDIQERFDKAVLKNYVQCVIKEQKWAESESLFKKLVRRDDLQNALVYLFWGQVDQAQRKGNEAERKFELAIQSLSLRTEFYTQLIEEFRAMAAPAYAKRVVQKAREVSKNENILRLEMAGICKDLGESENMVRELLAYGALVRNTEVVQNMLREFLKTEKDEELFEKVLYEQIQKRPNETFYNELLVWRQVQKKDFYKAFIQERSLDKRLKLNGGRIVELAKLSLQNEDYSNAILMFEYLLTEYRNTDLYSFARRMAIFSREEQVKHNFPVKIAEVDKLIKDYEKLLEDIGVHAKTVEVLRNMARLYAFYKDDRKKAIELLTQAIAAGRADQAFVDRCKLDLGDIYVLENDHWEASLIYSQVEKSQKDDHLGYEAKLRNARLHYYKGDFELSKSVLDILKKATSREIANDANALSLLIMDNIGLDSSEDAMKAYAAVELLLFQQKYQIAIDTLVRLYDTYQDHSLADEILWLTAQTYMRVDSNEQAVRCLEQIVSKFHYDILADNALFEMARLHEEKLKQKERAMQMYHELIEKYPGSIFVAEARKRYRMLRGDTIN